MVSIFKIKYRPVSIAVLCNLCQCGSAMPGYIMMLRSGRASVTAAAAAAADDDDDDDASQCDVTGHLPEHLLLNNVGLCSTTRLVLLLSGASIPQQP